MDHSQPLFEPMVSGMIPGNQESKLSKEYNPKVKTIQGRKRNLTKKGNTGKIFIVIFKKQNLKRKS